MQKEPRKMMPAKWRPFDERLIFRREMDRLFDNFFGTESMLMSNGNWVPDIDVSETDDEIVVRMDIPGMDKEDIRVAMSGDYLTVSGERKEEKEEKQKHFFSMERRLGTFERTIPIPAVVNDKKVNAEYKSGVLVIHLPRTAEAKSHRIPITSR
jgi:HSP20 family protein